MTARPGSGGCTPPLPGPLNRMRRIAGTLVVLATLGWTGCSRAPDPAGPREALERYFAAARADDWQAFYQVVCSAYRQGRTPEEFSRWAQAATPGFAHAITARTEHEIIAVNVEGDRAKVDVRLQTPDLQAIPGLENRLPSEAEVLAAPLVPKNHTFDLLREEGEWRIFLAPPPASDPHLAERVEHAAEAFSGSSSGSQTDRP